MQDPKPDDSGAASGASVFRVHLPGFLIENETGLGEILHRVTATAGISPCGGCGARAAALNRWVAFTPIRRG